MKPLILSLVFCVSLMSADVTFAGHARAPFISKTVRPEFVGFVIGFSSEITKEDRKNKALESAIATFWATVANDPAIVRLSGSPEIERDYTGVSSSFSFVSYGRREDQIKDRVFILKKIGSTDDPVASAEEFAQFCRAIKLNDDVKVNLSGFYQGVFDANKYRDELVMAILTDVKKYGDSSAVMGLESSVVIEAHQNGSLRAFVPYAVTVTVSK